MASSQDNQQSLSDNMDWDHFLASLTATDNPAMTGFNFVSDQQLLQESQAVSRRANIGPVQQSLYGNNQSFPSNNQLFSLPTTTWVADPMTFATTHVAQDRGGSELIPTTPAACPTITSQHMTSMPSSVRDFPTPHPQLRPQPQVSSTTRHHPPYTIYYRQQNDVFTPDKNLLVEDGDVNDDDTTIADPCYAQLLHRCLKEVPGHVMTLKELYEWVRQHSQKARDPENKGWKNSVRHNLSMNAAFERVSATGAKKGSLWRLTDQALNEGVISTTRFRKDPKRKIDRHGAAPAIKRQQSGAKGGQATRNLKRARNAARGRPGTPIGGSRHFCYAQQAESSPYPHQDYHLIRHAVQPSMGFGHTPPETPYFFNSIESSSMPPPASYSNPHTPPQVQLRFDTSDKNLMSHFDLQHFDYTGQPMFANEDNITPETPSLATEASYYTDDMGGWQGPDQKPPTETLH